MCKSGYVKHRLLGTCDDSLISRNVHGYSNIETKSYFVRIKWRDDIELDNEVSGSDDSNFMYFFNKSVMIIIII